MDHQIRIENMTMGELKDHARKLESRCNLLYSSLQGTARELQRTAEDRDYFRESNSIFETKLHNIGAIVDSYFQEGTNPRCKLMSIRDILD